MVLDEIGTLFTTESEKKAPCSPQGARSAQYKRGNTGVKRHHSRVGKVAGQTRNPTRNSAGILITHYK